MSKWNLPPSFVEGTPSRPHCRRCGAFTYDYAREKGDEYCMFCDSVSPTTDITCPTCGSPSLRKVGVRHWVCSACRTTSKRESV